VAPPLAGENSLPWLIFDSTGAIQDVASTVVIWQRALGSNVGSSIPLGAA